MINAIPDRWLERLEARAERLLAEIRQYRDFQKKEAGDQGFLGERGLTQFCVEQLHRQPMTAREMLEEAERAGYEIPSRKILSHRLSMRNYRVGDIIWDVAIGKWRVKVK